MTKPRTPEPTEMDADYYPRMKIHRRWYLVVPELQSTDTEFNLHMGCAFYRPDRYNDEHNDYAPCAIMDRYGSRTIDNPVFKRHDCVDNGTIFVAPSKFPEYRALLVAQKLEGKP